MQDEKRQVEARSVPRARLSLNFPLKSARQREISHSNKLCRSCCFFITAAQQWLRLERIASQSPLTGERGKSMTTCLCVWQACPPAPPSRQLVATQQFPVGLASCRQDSKHKSYWLLCGRSARPILQSRSNCGLHIAAHGCAASTPALLLALQMVASTPRRGDVGPRNSLSPSPILLQSCRTPGIPNSMQPMRLTPTAPTHPPARWVQGHASITPGVRPGAVCSHAQRDSHQVLLLPPLLLLRWDVEPI